MINEVYMIIKPYDHWDNDLGEEKNLQAKIALYRFYKEIIKYKPQKVYRLYPRHGIHLFYLHFLFRIKKAFDEKNYMRVCNELCSLMCYEPFFQGRILINVIRILEENLELEGEK